MENIEKLVPDTSVIIESIVSKKIEKNELKVNEVVIHEAVLAELEHQANQGKSIGYLGLDELKRLKELSKKGLFEIRYSGKRPRAVEIKYASLGEIDSLIRELAWEEGATLITADRVQFKVGEAKGLKVIFVEQEDIAKKKLLLENFFDSTTMSVHLKENVLPYAKKGIPGEWKFIALRDKKLTHAEIRELSREIIENAKIRRDSFIEIEREGSTIVQLGKFRIVVTQPPFSDGWEITAVRPVRRLNLDDYNLSPKLLNRVSKQAEGILIAGSPGAGKSTFAQALIDYYASQDKIVKTVEAPRDLDLGDNITQYSISHADSQEIHDVLLLTRPDYTLFDEMRNTKDFKLFEDLRLAGIGLAGVVHAANPIDAIQRFLGRAELGVIPQVVDTVIFVKFGKIHKVLVLKMVIKVPSGMMEADLARPVVEVRDFESDKLEYEIYSYGEETVVIPVTKEDEITPTEKLAAKEIERQILKYCNECSVEVKGGNKAVIRVPKQDIAKIIGKGGEMINKIEQNLGISIDVEEIGEIKKNKKEIRYDIEEKHAFLSFYVNKEYSGSMADISVDEKYLFSATIGKKGEIRVHKKSQLANDLLNSFKNKKHVSISI